MDLENELMFLESLAFPGNDYCILNSDEYIYIVGSQLIIKEFQSSSSGGEKKDYCFQKADTSGYCCLDFSPFSKLICAVERGEQANLQVFQYTPKTSLLQLKKAYIPKAIEATTVCFSRDGMKIAVLVNEPIFKIYVYEINMDSDGLKIIADIDLPPEEEYRSIAFNPFIYPINKNLFPNPLNSIYLFALGKHIGSLIELRDTFPDDYECKFEEGSDEQKIKVDEERVMFKRYIITHRRTENQTIEYSDFCWDCYNNIYLSQTNSIIYCLNLNLQNTVIDENKKTYIKLSSGNATSIVLTQRFLVVATDDAKMHLVNMYIPEKELPTFRSSLGNPDNYKLFEIDRSMGLLSSKDQIVKMKYDSTFSKIAAVSRYGDFFSLFYKGEKLVKDKGEKDEITENQQPIEMTDVHNQEEGKFHKEQIIGISELGSTSQFLSLSSSSLLPEGKLIIWELVERKAKSAFYLDYAPSAMLIDFEGNFIITGSSEGVIRIYDISNRNIFRLIYQNKYLNNSIDKIVFTKDQNQILFFNKLDTVIYVLNGDVSKYFEFIGFIKLNFPILDIATHDSTGEVLVLVKKLLLMVSINYNIDLKGVKVNLEDIYSNYALKYEVKARKVDSDLNMIIKNPKVSDFFLTGTDRVFRSYALPQEMLENVLLSRKVPDNPTEIKGNDVTCGVFLSGLLVTGNLDGTVQIRMGGELTKFSRTHDFLNGGISAICFSPIRHLIYAGGFDGSIVLLAEAMDYVIPFGIENNLVANDNLETIEQIDSVEDPDVRDYSDILREEHEKRIKVNKLKVQGEIKEKIDKIKDDLYKLIQYNKSLEEIEQLKPEEMILDNDKIESEKKEGELTAIKEMKKYFTELCCVEILKSKYYEKTFNIMTQKNPENGQIINNNTRIVFNLKGEKLVKTYPLRRVSDEETQRLNYIKQLRLVEIIEKNKRKADGIKEYLDEHQFSNLEEPYIVNRQPGKITLVEEEMKPIEVHENYESDTRGGVSTDVGKRQNKMARYKLQRDPYENENMNKNKNDDNQDQIVYKADDQLMKDDMNLKFKTQIIKFADMEYKNPKEVDSFCLLYSPFELYTNYKIRNQIYLLIDTIQNLKSQFNKEFKVFIVEKAQIIDKLNSSKYQIDSIRDTLPDVVIDQYDFTPYKYEDNEYINKIEEGDLKVEKYLSKEAKEKIAEEERIEQLRIKALQGDTLEMRGLKHMLDGEPGKGRSKEKNEENELVREVFMDNKEKREWTEEEIKKVYEYQKKEIEIKERKEKQKSQNLTKLNNLKQEIENDKITLETKIQKMVKKKMYYDYRIEEQELYILTLLRTCENRENIKKFAEEFQIKYEESKHKEEEAKRKLVNFNDNKIKFYNKYNQVMERKEMNNKKMDFKTLNELDEDDKRNLKDIRADPFYFIDREYRKFQKTYGSKQYYELVDAKESINTANVHANMKLYYDYKSEQFKAHNKFLEGEVNEKTSIKDSIDNQLRQHKKEYEKSLLNFDILCRINRAQDELTNEHGQNNIDQSLFIDKNEIMAKNQEINNVYDKKVGYLDTAKDQKDITDCLSLMQEEIQLNNHEIRQKLRYIKLTKVTKKNQDIVTGREEINPEDILKDFNTKKKTLEDNKERKLQGIKKKKTEIQNEIAKKQQENYNFTLKLQKLKDDVQLKSQIVKLDTEEKDGEGEGEEENQKESTNPKNNRGLEIAKVTQLKNLVQQYYEEIEYLRTELDKLRARTFPSFLQKPDQLIYPDEK